VRILVVEDSPVIQKLIDMCLRDMGVDITFCSSGDKGLQHAMSEPYHLVVLDIGLPGMDGWTVLSEIRAHDATSNLPVMVLTAHGRSVQQKADERGANMALSKPFNPADFRQAVGELAKKAA
jgi:CheY-like chemotaxis protein